MPESKVFSLVDAVSDFLGGASAEPRLAVEGQTAIEGVDGNMIEAFGEATGRGLPTEVAEFYGAEGSPCELIPDSFSEFLRHFIGAGCFHCGGAERAHFEAYWEVIEPFVPFGIAPGENLWLKHLDRLYDGDITK